MKTTLHKGPIFDAETCLKEIGITCWIFSVDARLTHSICSFGALSICLNAHFYILEVLHQMCICETDARGTEQFFCAKYRIPAFFIQYGPLSIYSQMPNNRSIIRQQPY